MVGSRPAPRIRAHLVGRHQQEHAAARGLDRVHLLRDGAAPAAHHHHFGLEGGGQAAGVHRHRAARVWGLGDGDGQAEGRPGVRSGKGRPEPGGGDLARWGVRASTRSTAFVTGSSRPQPLRHPPPTACLTAAGAASEAPSLLLHRCPPKPPPPPCLVNALVQVALLYLALGWGKIGLRVPGGGGCSSPFPGQPPPPPSLGSRDGEPQGIDRDPRRAIGSLAVLCGGGGGGWDGSARHTRYEHVPRPASAGVTKMVGRCWRVSGSMAMDTQAHGRAQTHRPHTFFYGNKSKFDFTLRNIQAACKPNKFLNRIP